jgi:hypothetical protein
MAGSSGEAHFVLAGVPLCCSAVLYLLHQCKECCRSLLLPTGAGSCQPPPPHPPAGLDAPVLDLIAPPTAACIVRSNIGHGRDGVAPKGAVPLQLACSRQGAWVWGRDAGGEGEHGVDTNLTHTCPPSDKHAEVGGLP